MNALSWWWPTPERLNEVLLMDAYSHNRAVVLAVHQRMRILKRKYSEPIGVSGADVVDERAILGRLTEPVPDGTQVTLVEGKSGTGKSHVVHWLKIQLERRSDTSTRVVLPVGKGSRLRDIVANLCAQPELSGPEHIELRNKLGRAQDPIDPADAAGRLCQQLAYVCQTRHDLARKKLETGHALSELELLYRKWGHPAQLPHILVYLPLRQTLAGSNGPMMRLVENLHARASIFETREQQEFLPSDLEFEDLPDTLDITARTVLGHLESPANRREAALVLNDGLDEAKRILVGLNPGVVADVLKSIRAVLLAQRKELILLVEDFADLSGLQREVLQAAIQTSTDSLGGPPKYCTLRTVLAYTDNLIQEGTVLSRAQHVYYVPSYFDEQSALTQAVGLIAAYLRAARFGKDALEASLHAAAEDQNWLPPAPELDDHAQALLNAFGTGGEGVPLFPFSVRAIERLLADQYGVENDSDGAPFPYIPRDIVTSVMRRILDHRESFLAGSFPSEGFVVDRKALLGRAESDWLMRAPKDATLQRRLRRFLPYWGLNKLAARAFLLPEPDAALPIPDQDTAVESRPAPPPPSTIAPVFGSKERIVFDNWRGGSTIVADRNAIRKSLAASIQAAFAWNWLPRADSTAADFEGRWKTWQEGLNIAGMPEAQSVSLQLELVTVAEREDPAWNERTARELASVYASPSVPTWDVEGVETYLAAHMSFVERHRYRVQTRLLAYWHHREWDILPWLVATIQHFGAALGAPKAKSASIDEFLLTLFAAAPTGVSDVQSDWRRETLTRLRSLRESLQRILLREVGAFQGRGETLHALDVTRLIPLIAKRGEATLAELAVPEFPPNARGPQLDVIKEAKTAIRDSDRLSRQELKARRERAEKVRKLLGEDIDKDSIVMAVRAFKKAASDAGVITEADVQQLERAAKSLMGLSLMTSLRSAEALPASDVPLWDRLVALGANEPDEPALLQSLDVVNSIKRIMDTAASELAGTIQVDPLDEALAVHRIELDQARTLLEEFSGARTEKETT